MIVRVKAKTQGGVFRQISISDDGSSVACDCQGYSAGFCAHIDAVLVAGERAMVIEDDHPIADLAMTLVAKTIATPENWKAAWRNNRAWRGLSRSGTRRAVQRRDGKSIVCFTGGKAEARNRTEFRAEAEANGWATINSASRSTDVLVADDVYARSGKLKAARAYGTLIVSYGDWQNLMTDGVIPA